MKILIFISFSLLASTIYGAPIDESAKMDVDQTVALLQLIDQIASLQSDENEVLDKSDMDRWEVIADSEGDADVNDDGYFLEEDALFQDEDDDDDSNALEDSEMELTSVMKEMSSKTEPSEQDNIEMQRKRSRSRRRGKPRCSGRKCGRRVRQRGGSPGRRRGGRRGKQRSGRRGGRRGGRKWYQKLGPLVRTGTGIFSNLLGGFGGQYGGYGTPQYGGPGGMYGGGPGGMYGGGPGGQYGGAPGGQYGGAPGGMYGGGPGGQYGGAPGGQNGGQYDTPSDDYGNGYSE